MTEAQGEKAYQFSIWKPLLSDVDEVQFPLGIQIVCSICGDVLSHENMRDGNALTMMHLWCYLVHAKVLQRTHTKYKIVGNILSFNNTLLKTVWHFYFCH